MVAQFDTHTTTYGPAMVKMLAAFPQAREKYNGYYEHADNPRFDFRVRENGSIFIQSWTGRSEDEILAMGGLKRSDISLNGRTYIGPTKDSLDLFDIAIAKGIHHHFLESLGLQSGYRFGSRHYVKVPYFNADGTQHTRIKVRKAIEGEYKQVWDGPGEDIPYGLHKLDMARDAGYLLIGEGESDGWACWYHGIPYLGVPGSTRQKTLKHLDINLLPAKIYILLEPDQKGKLLENGQSFYKNVHQELRKDGYKGEIFCIDFQKATEQKDPSALHIALWKDGKSEQFKEIIHQAMEQAIPANDVVDEAPTFAIQDERVFNALVQKKLQALYALAPEIAEMDAMEQSRIKLAASDIWKKDFPSREFEGLLRAARQDNERKRQPEPDFITAYDLMQLHFDPVDFVVPDILPTGLIVLGGKQKIGKSWFDLNVCLGVAYGGMVLGKYQVRQGDVLYMALEDHQRRLQDRMKQLLAPGSKAPEALTIVTKWERMDEGGLERLESWIMSHPNARLVMIDPWVLVKPKGKTHAGETGYDVEYKALEGVKKLADKYGICILIQFHLRKANADDPFDELNATTGVTACADGFISLKRARCEEEGTLFASGRDYKEEVNLAMSFKNGTWKVLGEGQTAAYYGLSQERRAVIDLLCSKFDPYGIVQPTMPKDIATLLDIRDGTIRQLLSKMKEDGQVKWVSKEEPGAKEGYISLIPSPKQQQTNKNSENHSDTGDGADSGDTGDGDDASHSGVYQETEQAQTVTDEQESAAETEEDSVTDVTSVITVTGVTGDSGVPADVIPMELLQECRELYARLQQVPTEQLAPLGTLMWNVPDSGIQNDMVNPRQYVIRLHALLKSGDVRKIRAGRDEMLRKLAQMKG